MPAETANATGGCPCGQVRYKLLVDGMWVHCCHCRWCQRETGSAFALNIFIETTNIQLLENGKVEHTTTTIATPSESGSGQEIIRCSKCQVAIWSFYDGPGPEVACLRSGTLDDASVVEPDVHIYTTSKMPWVVIPEGSKVFEEYYDRKSVWTAESSARLEKALEARKKT